MLKSLSFATLAYLVPTFAIAYVWHLYLFAHRYEALAIYRDELIVPFGFVAILIQGIIFALFFGKVFGSGPIGKQGIAYGLTAGLLSWTFTTLAVAAKFPMTSIADFVVMETGFTVLQFAVVGPLTACAWRLGLPT